MQKCKHAGVPVRKLGVLHCPQCEKRLGTIAWAREAKAQTPAPVIEARWRPYARQYLRKVTMYLDDIRRMLEDGQATSERLEYIHAQREFWVSERERLVTALA